jgi:hypothetical protein
MGLYADVGVYAELKYTVSAAGRPFSVGVRTAFMSPPTPKSPRRIVPSDSTNKFPALTSRCRSARHTQHPRIIASTYMDKPPRVEVRQALQDLLDNRFDLLLVEDTFDRLDLAVLFLLPYTYPREMRSMGMFRRRCGTGSPV